MRFNNYLVEDTNGDVKWGRGHQIILDKEGGVTCYLDGLQEAYKNFDLSNIFPLPPPPYINNDQSLNC